MDFETDNSEIITTTKLYIYLPYDDRQYMKEQKCKFDGELKLWYVISKDDPLYQK